MCARLRVLGAMRALLPLPPLILSPVFLLFSLMRSFLAKTEQHLGKTANEYIQVCFWSAWSPGSSFLVTTIIQGRPPWSRGCLP